MKTFATLGVLLLFCMTLSRAQPDTGSECEQYRELNDAWRSVLNYRPDAVHWDAAICDGNETDVGHDGGWYRFTGDAGDRMPIRPPTKFRCGGHAGVYMNGQHPYIDEGIVTRQACAHFHDENKNDIFCLWSWDIQVRLCPDGYYVYKLPAPVTCKLAYCGTLEGQQIPEEQVVKHVPDL